MGISAKPMPGKFQSMMRKIKNQRDAEIYTAKHMLDKKKESKQKHDEVAE